MWSNWRPEKAVYQERKHSRFSKVSATCPSKWKTEPDTGVCGCTEAGRSIPAHRVRRCIPGTGQSSQTAHRVARQSVVESCAGRGYQYCPGIATEGLVHA